MTAEETLETARSLRDRLYHDASNAKTREEYLRTLASYHDAYRIAEALESLEAPETATV